MNKIERIDHYCDTPMAVKKGFFPCNKDCKACTACILIFADGKREHVSRSRSEKKE